MTLHDQKLSSEGQLIADFLTKIASGLYKGEGINVGMADLKVAMVAKTLKDKGENVRILQRAFVQLEQTHPEFLDVVLFGCSEALKEKVRKAAGRSDPIDAEKVP